MPPGKLEKSFQIFRFLRSVSVYLGLPTFYAMYVGRKSNEWLSLFKLYATLTELITWTLAIRMSLRLFIEPFSVSALVETACTVGYVLVELSRFLVLHSKRRTIAKYFREMENINYLSADKFLKIFESRDLFKKKLGRIIISYQITMAVLVFLVARFILPPEFVKMPASYPLKDIHPCMKYVYQSLDFLSAIYVPARIATIDLTCLTFITFHAAQQEHLKNQLGDILQEMKNGKIKEKKLREWFGFHQNSLR